MASLSRGCKPRIVLLSVRNRGYLLTNFIIFAFKQEFSRSMDLSQPMKDFASSLVAKATANSSSRSSLLRSYSDVSLSDMGDDKSFALTKALGYHVVYG